MSHPVLVLTRNSLDLTKRCLESVLKQDIPVQPWIIDNGSHDGTLEWARSSGFRFLFLDRNYGVTYPWNLGLNHILKDNDHCLVIGSDTIIPPWFYSQLMSYDFPFCTGIAVDNFEQIKECPSPSPPSPTPDYSAFFLTRDYWDEVGPFDERFKYYVQDCAMHLKSHKMGIPQWKVNLPYYHISSQTIVRASEEERREILEGANRDRQVFRDMYGTLPGTKEYEELFK